MKSPVRLFTALLIAATLPLLAVGCDVVVDSDSCGLEEDFACGDGTEVPAGWVCDDEFDCLNGLDEANCLSHVCGTGTQVPEAHVCDGENDCLDGSDEFDCGPCLVVFTVKP